MHLHIKAAIIAMRKENTPSKLTYFHSLSAIAEGLQVQVRNLHVSLLIIRKTGVKIIQGHHPSQPGVAQLLDQITNAF